MKQLKDDSIWLIKEKESQVEESYAVIPAGEKICEKTGVEGQTMESTMQKTLTETFKLLEEGIITQANRMHFVKPLEQNKMEAIQVLIEEENIKQMIAAGCSKPSQVVLEA